MPGCQHAREAIDQGLTRRRFFERVSGGTYGAALLYMFGKDRYGGSGLLWSEVAPAHPELDRLSYDLKPRPPHYQPKAKAVIQLVMQSGPSQVDLFDPKPKLDKLQGQQPTNELLANTDLDLDRIGGMLASPFQFAQHGQSGLWLSELLPHLDHIHQQRRPGELWLDARIAGYELAARMQLEAHEALDLTAETKATLEMYGVGEPKTHNFARRCLMARRLVERGVRFVQLCTAAQLWYTHHKLTVDLPAACEQTDKPTAALLQDLRDRGLLDETLVLWGGEFGRLPINELTTDKEIGNDGRGHGPHGFTTWVAGGGVKGGIAYGATDEIGFAAVENRVSVTDWHATVLHLLGLHHEQLFFVRNGFKERLTSTFPARVVKEVLA